MNPETHRVLNDPSLTAARNRHFDRLRRVFGGERLDPPVFIRGVFAAPGGGHPATGHVPSGPDPYSEPEEWVQAGLESLAGQAGVVRDPYVFRPLCLEFGPYGVHYVDRMFGARVYAGEGGQWWVDYLQTPIGQLITPDLEKDPTWKLSVRLARAFLEADVSVPLFGMPTIASTLNIAVNLYGPDLMTALYEDPEAVKRDFQTIHLHLVQLHRWYRSHIPALQLQPVVSAERCQPPGCGQLCGCTTHLISARIYREFVAPLDNALLGVYPGGGMIHLCGAHTQHIPVWRDMPNLKALQLNDRATEDFEAFYDQLRDDQVLYIIPTSSVTVDTVMRRTLGRRVVFIGEP